MTLAEKLLSHAIGMQDAAHGFGQSLTVDDLREAMAAALKAAAEDLIAHSGYRGVTGEPTVQAHANRLREAAEELTP